MSVSRGYGGGLTSLQIDWVRQTPAPTVDMPVPAQLLVPKCHYRLGEEQSAAGPPGAVHMG